MTAKQYAIRWLQNTKIRWALLAGIWLVLLVTVVIPNWQGVLQRNTEIKDLEVRLATMDDWTVAGMWLAKSVNERKVPVETRFSSLFPDKRARGELFLELGRVADKSGVEGFDLIEANSQGMEGNDVWGDGASMAAIADDGAMGDAPPTGEPMDLGMEMELPEVELTTYRLKAHFFGDYKRIARFMGGLKNIERAMKVHSLVIRPDKDGIQVDLELDIYVSQTSQS